MRQDAYLEMQRSETRHWWFVGRRAILSKILDCFSVKSKTRRILELGCGTGGNLEMLAAYGNLSAMELDDRAREFANKKNFCVVKAGSLPDNIPFSGGFDVIVIFDVLEHIEDDMAALKNIHDQLVEKGKVILTVPAYQFLWSNHDVVLDHKRRYTRSRLRELIEQSGFRVVYSTYFNIFLFPVIVVARMIKNIMKTIDKTDVAEPSRFTNRLLKVIFSFEKIFLPRFSFPFGVSILFVAERIAK